MDNIVTLFQHPLRVQIHRLLRNGACYQHPIDKEQSTSTPANYMLVYISYDRLPIALATYCSLVCQAYSAGDFSVCE